MISILRTLNTLGLDRTDPVAVKGVSVSPRDVVAACLPDPVTIGPRMTGKTCAGLYVTGQGNGTATPGGVPLPRHRQRLVDEQYDTQCVVWQTAVNPVVALELLASGAWSGVGVLGPEPWTRCPSSTCSPLPVPEGYGSPWGMEGALGPRRGEVRLRP